MKKVALCLLTCTTLQGYVEIQVPDKEMADACREEFERLLYDQPKKQCFGFFMSNDEDPEDPFLEPSEHASVCLDNITEFEQIPLQDWERQIISFIITEMAEKNVFQLLLQKNEMESKGRKINHVHPLRFIGHVCSDQKLRRALKVVKKNPFKWSNFIEGLGRRLKEEAGKNNLTRFLPSFCRYLQSQLPVDEEQVVSYIRQVDGEGLMRYLISI